MSWAASLGREWQGNYRAIKISPWTIRIWRGWCAVDWTPDGAMQLCRWSREHALPSPSPSPNRFLGGKMQPRSCTASLVVLTALQAGGSAISEEAPNLGGEHGGSKV